MKSHFVVLPLLVAVAGCASAPTEQVANQAQTCDREYKVGSMVPKKECSTAMTQEERQHMKDEMERQLRTGTSAPKPPGKG